MSSEAHAHAEEHHDAAPAHGAPAHGHDEHAPAAHGAHGHEAANDNKEHAPDHGAHGHKAANDNKEHGPAHGAHGPKAAHAPAHGDAHGAHPAAGGKSPIIAFRDWIFDTSSSVVNTTTEIGHSINKYLSTDGLETGSDRKSLLETPFYAAGHVVEGTVGNAARRSMEVISPIFSFVRSAISTTIGTILKPSNLKNGETKKNAIGMVKSAGMLGKNLLMAVPRAANEFADFAVDRTVQQISSQIERIPVVGKFISTPLKWISGTIKKSVAAVTNLADKITSPLGGNSAHAAPAAHGGHDSHGHADSHAAPAHH